MRWSPARSQHEHVGACEDTGCEIVEIDALRARPRLLVLLREPGPQRRHRRGGQLPELFTRFGLDAPVAGLELEVEVVTEQPPDVLLVRPLAGVGVFDE